MDLDYTNSDPRDRLRRRYLTARLNLLILIAISIVNIILLLCKSNFYLLFSASIPYYLVVYGMVITGNLTMEGVNVSEPLPNGILFALIAAAIIILGVYFLCFYFGKKKPVWMIIALAMFILDTVVTVITIPYSSGSYILDLVMHAYILCYLALGVYGSFVDKRASEDQLLKVKRKYAEKIKIF